MAVKKSEIYNLLWASCEELGGGMNASQYKDYILVLLFMKYVSDKKDSHVELKPGTTFYDMLRHRGKPDIGNQINKIIAEFAKNNGLSGIIDYADFNDDAKLGTGKEKVDRLTNLLNIFNKPELNLSANRADGDDLLGDAYERLMYRFAVENVKSKGQFYTPSEVSCLIAELIGIRNAESPSQTLYDPTCGTGSLLLKAADLAPHGIAIYGQETDKVARAIAVMNMWLHGHPEAEIALGNTLAAPQFVDETTGELKTFDYIVANPPFSCKSWMNGLDPTNDIYRRFEGYNALPPQKNGDYAFLLHVIKSLKPKGKACIVLPPGALFRGNAEGKIRKEIIKRGYIKAIISLPPNLFYGTDIAACLVVMDKEDANARTHILMIDASRVYKKDSNKNRLREQDIRKIADTFSKQLEIPKYSRLVPIAEIADPKNDYNLNIPRYINSQNDEDIHDIEAHLKGGIPKHDVVALENYWNVFPTLKTQLFKPIDGRPDYYELIIPSDQIKNVIFNHSDFIAFSQQMEQAFEQWKTQTIARIKSLEKGLRPKHEIRIISENLLKHYSSVVQTRHVLSLVDEYAAYQCLMDYWAETMHDDFYEIAANGWVAGNQAQRIKKKSNKGEIKIADLETLESLLIPPALIIQKYFYNEQLIINNLQLTIENLNAQMKELRDEHGGEDGLLSNVIDDKSKISKANLAKAIKELGERNEDNAEEWDMLQAYKKLMDQEADAQTQLKAAKAELEKKVMAQYPKLSIDEIKTFVIEKKWMAEIEKRIRAEIEGIIYRFIQRIKELAERYATPLPTLQSEVDELTAKVEEHLKKMGFVWK